MKKLLQKCLLLCLLVGFLLYLGGTAYRQTNAYRNLERRERTEEYRTMPDQIDIAVFGASHGQHDFQFFPEKSSPFNFSMSSQTPQYDAAQLRQYEDRLRPGAIVILTASYLSPFWTDTESQFQAKQARYYRILSPENIVDVNWAHFMLGRFSPLLTTDYSSILHAFYPGEDLIPVVEEQVGSRKLSPANIIAEQSRIRNDHLSAITPAFPEGNSVMLAAYEEILTRCSENCWKAVLVTPPYPDVYSSCFSADFYPVFYEKIRELSERYDVPYLDYSHDTAFVGNYSLFMDIDHLNLTGAEQFDRQFFADLPAALAAGAAYSS